MGFFWFNQPNDFSESNCILDKTRTHHVERILETLYRVKGLIAPVNEKKKADCQRENPELRE